MMRTTTVDWPAIETAFKGTRKSTRELARIAGVSETAIRKRAKAGGWVRPEPEPDLNGRSLPKPEPEPDMSRVAVEPSEAGDTGGLVEKGRGLVLALMAELEVENANISMLEELVEIETAQDRSPHRRRALQKALSLPTRAQAAKNLAGALATLRDAEPGKKEQRQANANAASTAGKFAAPSGPKLAVDNTRR